MIDTDTRTPALGDRLAIQLTVAEPDLIGGLCVFPLIADRRPTLDYLAFADERSHGVQIKEVAGSFAPAPHTAYPELRRLKNEQVRERLAAGAEPRAAQGEVWREVAAKSARHGARSDTGALRDIFEQRRETIDGGRARDRDRTRAFAPGRT